MFLSIVAIALIIGVFFYLIDKIKKEKIDMIIQLENNHMRMLTKISNVQDTLRSEFEAMYPAVYPYKADYENLKMINDLLKKRDDQLEDMILDIKRQIPSLGGEFSGGS